MISKELKSQLSILKETNPEYIQTLKDAVTASYKAELQAIKPSSTEEEEQLNIPVITMPSKDGNPITRKQKSFINLRYQTYSNN